jgi:hypothetical protein
MFVFGRLAPTGTKSKEPPTLTEVGHVCVMGPHKSGTHARTKYVSDVFAVEVQHMITTSRNKGSAYRARRAS